MLKSFYSFLFLLLSWGSLASADNQTDTLSPILPGTQLPFIVQIEQADFSLPNGIHSFASAIYKDKWLFITGRTNGMHTFNNAPNNFPPSAQNRVVYVVDPIGKQVFSRSLEEAGSGLTQNQIDILSVTSPQFYQHKRTLYITGGYGVDSSTGQFTTFPTLTAIDVPGLIHWVTRPSPGELASQHIRTITDPIFRVTGGYMTEIEGTTLLVFGQDFEGFYFFPVMNGIYTEQVRRFKIIDDGINLSIKIKAPYPAIPDPNFRRRDLNVVPIVQKKGPGLFPGLLALSGVFTLTDGAWTVPVLISSRGVPFMPSPDLPETLKQGMNNYVCSTVEMYSKKYKENYIILLGGITFGYFVNGNFQTDSELPFTNQVTTIKLDKHNVMTQYFMESEFPTIVSTQSNPGNTLLFGAAAEVMPAPKGPFFKNLVLKFDSLKNDCPEVVAYIVGGIQSTLPNTNTASDSAASPYIFKVIVTPVRR